MGTENSDTIANYFEQCAIVFHLTGNLKRSLFLSGYLMAQYMGYSVVFPLEAMMKSSHH